MVTMDYKKLTMNEMIEWIAQNHNDKKSKAAFKAKAIDVIPQTQLVTVLDESGNPIMITDKKGRQVAKKKRIPIEGGEKIEKVNTLAAKAYFYETYKEEINFINAPTKAKTSIKDLLANW